MNRNVTIIVIILIIVLLAAYLVWLRGRFITTQTPSPMPQVVLEASPSLVPTSSPSVSASVSATPRTSPTPSVKPKLSSPSPKSSAS